MQHQPPTHFAADPPSPCPAPPLLPPAATVASPYFGEMNVSLRLADLFAFAAALRGGDHAPAVPLATSHSGDAPFPSPAQTGVAPACHTPLCTSTLVKSAFGAEVCEAASPVTAGPTLDTTRKPPDSAGDGRKSDGKTPVAPPPLPLDEPPPLLPPDDDRVLEDMDWLDFVSEGDDDVGPVLVLPQSKPSPPPVTKPPQLPGLATPLNRDSPLPSTGSECGAGVRPPNTPPAASLPRRRSLPRINTPHFDVNLLPPLLRPFADQLQPPPPGGMTQAVPIVALVPEHLTRARPRCPSPTRRRGRVRRTDHLLVQDDGGGLVLMSPAEYQRLRRCVTNVASARRVANARRGGSSTDDGDDE